MAYQWASATISVRRWRRMEMPLLTMLDPPDEPPLQQTEKKKKKKEKDAKKTNPPAAAEPEPQPIEPEPPPMAPDPQERHRPRQWLSLSSEHARRPESAQPSQLPPVAQ
jgi:hypothetical protein